MHTESPLNAVSPLRIAGNTVLVVEDDPRVRRMLSDAFKEMAYTATFAASAEAGEREATGKQFDALILDLNLPGAGGIEFLEKLRRQGNTVPAIILTGFGDLDAARKAIHLDVVDFLTKPCTLGSLESAMARARQRRRAQVVEQAAASADPQLRLDVSATMPAFAPAATAATTETASMEEVERLHIVAVLQKHKGNRTATAAELGISLRKLYYRLGEYQRRGLMSRAGDE